MIYTTKTKRAIQIMYQSHKNQFDKSGIPYVFHPWHVAEQMDDENSTIVALLHDVVEDSNITFDNFYNEDFDSLVIDALKLLTHDKDKDYYEYIEMISKNELAKKVKIADLKHNCDLSRLNEVNQADLSRVEKYKNSIKFLENH